MKEQKIPIPVIYMVDFLSQFFDMKINIKDRVFEKNLNSLRKFPEKGVWPQDGI